MSANGSEFEGGYWGYADMDGRVASPISAYAAGFVDSLSGPAAQPRAPFASDLVRNYRPKAQDSIREHTALSQHKRRLVPPANPAIGFLLRCLWPAYCLVS